MITAETLRSLPREQRVEIYRELCRRERQSRLDGSNDIVTKYRGDPMGFITRGIRQGVGDSWRTWRIVLKAAYGVPLDEDELVVFREVAQRDPPPHRVKELWLVIGARGGKDSVASMIATEAASYADEGVALRPGERVLVACFATSLRQAQIVYNYTKAYFEDVPSLRKRVVNRLTSGPTPICLDNNVDIVIAANNFRAPRGWPIALAVFDECAFWRDEQSATPDVETYTAVLRGMGTIPNAMIVGISTPHRQKGLLYDKWHKHFGKDNPDILVVQGPTIKFCPIFQQSVIDRAMEEDPERAGAEYLAQWRRDLADYVLREVAEAAIVRGRTGLAPEPGIAYQAFCDPSGGSRDSMTLAIGHADLDRGVLDCVLETRAPFNPAPVVKSFAATLRAYGLTTVRGDRYGGGWPAERFAEEGITYLPAEQTKNDIYHDFLPVLNAHRCDLLDHQRMLSQLCDLECRTIRGGRDSIDHPQNGYDDVINSVAGVMVSIVGDRASTGSRWSTESLVNTA